MKEILMYSSLAILLGVATMLAPLALYVSEMDMETEPFFASANPEDMRTMSSKNEQTQGITSAAYPVDVLFIAFVLALSFAMALGVMRYSMRKAIF